MSGLRRIRRYVAKRTMKQEGLHKICKSGFFAKNWKFYL